MVIEGVETQTWGRKAVYTTKRLDIIVGTGV